LVRGLKKVGPLLILEIWFPHSTSQLIYPNGVNEFWGGMNWTQIFKVGGLNNFFKGLKGVGQQLVLEKEGCKART